MTPIHPYRTMLILHDLTALDKWVRLALNLTPAPAEIVLRGLLTVPENLSLSEGAVEAQTLRQPLDAIAAAEPAVHDETKVYVDYRPMERALAELRTAPVDLLLVQWCGPLEPTGGLTTDHILQAAPCDVALVSRGELWAEGPVLLSLRGGPNISLGVQTARALAGGHPITLFHATDQRTNPALELLTRVEPQISRAVTAHTGIAEGIVGESAAHNAVVMGASFRQPEGAASSASPVVQQVYEQTVLPVIVVRAWQPETTEFHAPRRLRRAYDTLSTRVDRWFAENTFHSHEFADVRALLAMKEKQGVSISLGLPALNEAATVGSVITTLKQALMDDVPLLDEMVLIDSDSTDDTVAIAESLGIPAYRHPEILPEEGTYVGKGEALWKSLHALSGDIIAWVDTDITNIHPRFIYGLIGPLLRHPHLQYTKGFYNRPIKVDGKLQAYGGGRVTELVARPLLNLFYPELSGIVQPLSGEYAGRRAALEQMPFFSGYGVETGLLIDLWDSYGLDGIAQTDLEVRVHHNQPLSGLSKMSFAILQVFIARLEHRFGVQLLDKANRSMKLVIQEPERLALDVNEITDVERPPMATVPAYQSRRN